MRTYGEIVTAALARALDWNVRAPSTKSVMYERISAQQQELLAFAAQVNPEYYGVAAIGTLDAGAIDLNLMAGDGVLEAEAISKVFVEDEGTHEILEAGDEVTVIPGADDPTAFLAPRVRVRNKVIEAIAEDLDGVTSIRVEYSFKPVSVSATEDGSTEVVMDRPFDDLLVIDLARDLARKSLQLEPEVKSAIATLLNEEEKELKARFEAHLLNFLAGQTSRFGRTQGRRAG